MLDDARTASTPSPTPPPDDDAPDEGGESVFERGVQRCAAWIGRHAGALVAFSLVVLPAVLVVPAQSIGVKWGAANTLVTDGGKYKISLHEYETAFGPYYRTGGLIAVSQTGDILADKEQMLALLDVQEELMFANLTLSSEPDRPFSLLDVCLPATAKNKPDGCVVLTPLDFWESDREEILDDRNLYRTVSRTGYSNRYGIPVNASTVFGALEMPKHLVEGAEAGIISFVLRQGEGMTPQHVRRWEAHLVDTARALNNTAGLTLYATSETSFEEAVQNAVSSDSGLVIGGMVSGIVFCALCATWVFGNAYGFAVAMYGVYLNMVSMVLAIVLAEGILGAVVSPLTLQCLPLLLIGIGTDAIFLIMCAFKRLQRLDHTLRYAARALAFSGMMIATTFIMTAIVSTMPAIRALCEQVTVSILVNMAVQLLFLSALLHLWRPRLLTPHPAYAKLPTTRPPCRATRNREIAVVAVFGAGIVALTVIGIYQLGKLELRLPLDDLVPGNSPAASFLPKMSEYQSDAGPLIFLYMDDPDFDYATPEAQQSLRTLAEDLVETGNLKASFIYWYDNFISWVAFLSTHKNEYVDAGRVIPADKFYPWLHEFINDVGSIHELSLVFKEPGGELAAMQMLTTVISPGSVHGYMDFINTTRHLSPEYTDLPVKAFCSYFSVFEQFSGIWSALQAGMWASLALALVSSLIVLRSAAAAVLTIVYVLTVQLGTVGLLGVADVHGVNAASVVSFLTVVGLTFAYVLHVANAHFAPRPPGSPVDVSPVLMGVLSTLISVAPLSAATLPIIQLFFGFCYVFNACVVLIHLPVIHITLRWVRREPTEQGRAWIKLDKRGETD